MFYFQVVFTELIVSRDEKWGGNKKYDSYEKLEDDFKCKVILKSKT